MSSFVSSWQKPTSTPPKTTPSIRMRTQGRPGLLKEPDLGWKEDRSILIYKRDYPIVHIALEASLAVLKARCPSRSKIIQG